jgi:hypothetical protein
MTNMVVRRIKKLIAWALALGVLGLIALGLSVVVGAT